MPIKRSQSAPQPIETLFPPSIGTSKQPQTNILRSKSYLVQPSVAVSPIVTPRFEREDPFSLGGFFPASPRVAPEEEEQWKWLHKEMDEEDAARADRGTDSSFTIDDDDDDDSVIGQLEDRLAEETIKSEDKFGLLSLGNDLSF